MKDRIVSTIEARMTSSRLPGKVLMEAGGKPMLQILIERLNNSKYIHEIAVATTINKEDDPIVDLCNKLNIKYYRGSENNVLDRVCKTAESVNAGIIVEITGDCPLIDPDIVDNAIEVFFEKYPGCKYVSNSGPDISMPWGFDVQIFKFEDLKKLNLNPDDLEKEHVSYGFYRDENQKKYNPHFIKYSGKLNRPDLRITLDYYEDYIMIKEIYESLSEKQKLFNAYEIINYLDNHPHLNEAAIKVRNII